VIPATTFRNRTVAVFGLARSGLDAARALMAGGADVVCADDARPRVVAAAGQGFATADLGDFDWSALAALVLSPGVPLTHPEPHWTVTRARQAGVEIIGDTELFFRERAARHPDTPVLAVTGTNGKSTTTALIGHILAAAGRTVSVGGNIGAAVLGLEPMGAGRAYVLEMSSFQIDLTPTLNPDVGVLLNVTPDHLDRHGTLENYAAIKARMADAADIVVIATDDEWTAAVADRVAGAGRPLRAVSATRELDDGVFVRAGRLIEARAGAHTEIADISGVRTLRGAHNWQNAAAAAAAALALGLSREDIARALRGFPGLAHRMEPVGRLGKVLFVNDSKATNTEAAARALGSFKSVYWIAGGRQKQPGLDDLKPYFANIRRAFLIGEAAENFAATFGGSVAHEISGELSAAVLRAAEAAEQDESDEPVVLLAPACTSFDQFPDFEARGEAFRRLVSGLDGVVMDRGEPA
jgi:UDP-N-acetylmuramoylalanine--D-glutamate ligase